jgi:hypothetical protein
VSSATGRGFLVVKHVVKKHDCSNPFESTARAGKLLVFLLSDEPSKLDVSSKGGSADMLIRL